MKFKEFQLQDLARAACHDGLILGWDTGLGKSLAAFAWPLLKCGFTHLTNTIIPSGRILLIAPGDLHQQLIAEAQNFFHLPVTPLDSQATFTTLTAGNKPLPNGFYITSYTQLATNGTLDFPDPDKIDPATLMRELSLKTAEVQTHYSNRSALFRTEYATLGVNPADTLATLERKYSHLYRDAERSPNPKFVANRQAELTAAYNILTNLCPASHQQSKNPSIQQSPFFLLSPTQQTWVTRHFLKTYLAYCAKCNGAIRPLAPAKNQDADTESDADPIPIKCVFSPTLSDLCFDAVDCVVIDEGVKMKGNDTLIGQGVRQMNPPYRLVLTATPIKNRLPDVFWLAHWATGAKPHAHARFPYAGQLEEKEEFAKTFLISERNRTKENKAEAKRRYQKLTAEVCNIHRLWKLMAPILLRRRKKDIGEDIIPKIRHVIRAPMGKQQAAVYQYHLKASYLDKNLMPAPGVQLQALRMVSCAPHSPLLRDMGHIEDRSTLDTPVPLPHSSTNPFIPKIATTLSLTAQILERGEQVVIGSAFCEPLDTLSRYLHQAEVNHCLLDGRTSQKRRGQIANTFKAGKTVSSQQSAVGSRQSQPTARCPLPVMLAGVECMAEGHSFHRCNNIVLISYSWAYDKFEQFINRVHRLNSEKPVNVYVVICDGSIDRKLEASIHEKADSAELVLDGQLLTERSEELNLNELLAIAQKEFNPDTNTIDEARILADWPALRARLSQAALSWSTPSTQSIILLPAPAPAFAATLSITPPPDRPLPPPFPRQSIPVTRRLTAFDLLQKHLANRKQQLKLAA